MKKLFILLLSVLFSQLVALADVAVFPKRTVENVADGIIVTYNFRNPIIYPNHFSPGSFLWKYSGFGVNDTPGEPAVPFRTDMFYIPAGYNAQITLQDATYKDTTLVLSPAIPNLPDNGLAIAIDSITPYAGFYPNNVLEYGSFQKYHGISLQSVTIIPIRYNYSQHIVRAYTEIKYKVTFVHDNDRSKLKENGLNNMSDITKTFLSNVTLNFSASSNPSRAISDSTWHSICDQRNYLILTTTEYLDSIQEFVEWKRLKGNDVQIETRPKGWWTPQRVKSLIDFLSEGDFHYDYLLIIGGNEDVPGEPFIFSSSEGFCYAVTDYEYGLIAGNNLPQIFRGRITGDNNSEIASALNKIIQYEKNPIMDEAFYKTALHCAQFQDNREGIKDGYEDHAFVLTSENIREHLRNRGFNVYRQYKAYATDTLFHWSNEYSNGDTIPTELQPGTFLWNGNADSIRNIINNGTLYVFYRGHGDTGCWYNPFFQNSDISQLQNGRKLPVIFSIACLNGKYNTSDCFAENALKKQEGGCVGIIAPTEISFSGNNDALALGMFDAIWPNLQLTYPFIHYSSYTNVPNPIYELGPILDQGLFRMGETYGMWGLQTETCQLFHCFGDPSMRIYTDKPTYFVEPSIFSRGDSIFVYVEDGDSRITFYDKVTKEIKSYKGNYAGYANPSDRLVICLDRHNYVPYIWDYSKDIYIQNEDICGETRNYTGNSIYVGNNVTSTKPTGNVTIHNSCVNIHGKRLELHPGTQIAKNFKFQNR